MRPKTGQNPGKGQKYDRRAAWFGGAALAALPAPAFAAPPGLSSALAVSAVAAGALALALAAGIWAIAEQTAAQKLRRALKGTLSRARAAVGERDALIDAGREAVVVWSRDRDQSTSYGGADALIDSCLGGEDALAVSEALDGLSAHGTAFSLVARDRNGRGVQLRGRAVGGMAAVWLSPEAVAVTGATDFRTVLDALPLPVWLRDRSLSLAWGNRAFLTAIGASDVDTARAQQVALERGERDLAASARTQGDTIEARRFAVVAGQRRALSITEAPLDGMGIVGSAIDVTDVSSAEARLQQHIDAHSATLDQLATAVAIFDRDQKLTFYNRAFIDLWDLDETWLDGRPNDGEILDRLREGRKLPEQRDYLNWRRERLALYGQAGEHPPEDIWHVPGGKTLRVVSQPHPFGGLTYLYEDVTEKIALESSYNTLMRVQSATLDTLQEGVAVFGPDGKLKLHNAAFARIWDLSARELDGEPHVRLIAVSCAEKFGGAAMWERLIQTVASGTNGKRDLGEIERNDRTILSLAISPLPDGATLVTFADVTDRSRIEGALRDRNEALEAADRLKSDFIKHVSYELRTPLNTILGFSEHLSSEIPGALNQRQREYVDAIVSGSNSLKNLVSDILDLALIESGALRLELERIDLYTLIVEVSGLAREFVAKAGLTLELECKEDAGVFLGDKRRLRQVAFNLLANAFKYTPRGGAIHFGGLIEGDDVQIFVSDNGPGIAPEVKANVFERFAAKNRSGQRAGAGLGLALVNRFVELHDGWVELESGEGTRVRCHLPRRIHDEPTPTQDEQKKTA
jgi:signal transduction histidine kinase